MIKKLLLSGVFAAALFAGNQASATIHTIGVSNFAFTPNTLSFSLGDTVRWFWVSGTHTTTSTSVPAGAASWDNPITSSVTTFDYVPAVAGHYAYFCSIHPGMMTASFDVVCSSMPMSMTTPTGLDSFCEGALILLTSTGSSWTGTPTFTWLYSDGVSGFSPVPPADSFFPANMAGIYEVIVTDACGSDTSDPIMITETPAPHIVIDTTISGLTYGFSFSGDPVTAWSWLFGDGSPADVNAAPSHTYATAGTYTVTLTVTSSNGCLGDTTITINAGLGIDQFDQGGLTFHPNPASSVVIIDAEKAIVSAELHDMAGRLVAKLPLSVNGNRATADVSSIAPGIYSLTVSTVSGKSSSLISIIR